MAGSFAMSSNQATTSTAFKTALYLIGAATVTPKVIEFNISANATPADNTLVWQAQRGTVDGTGSAGTSNSTTYSAGIVTPVAALSTVKGNYSVEPTYTGGAIVWGPFSINQRASYRWVPYPNGGELIIPAVAAASIGWMVKSSAYTGESDACGMWIE